MKKVTLAQKFNEFTDQWAQRTVGAVDDYEIKIAKIQGEFVWHKHDDEDEMFFVVSGTMNMQFRDRTETLTAGELIVVPKGVEHCPQADEECQIMLFEHAGVVNTGDAETSDLTRQARPAT